MILLIQRQYIIFGKTRSISGDISLQYESTICQLHSYVIGCPPTHYGSLCHTTCPPNCKGPCEIDVGDCLLGCTNGWTGNRCDTGDNIFFM